MGMDILTTDDTPRDSRLRPRLKDAPDAELLLPLPIAAPDDPALAENALKDATTLGEAPLQDAALEDAAHEDAALEDAALEDAALEDTAFGAPK